MFIFESNHNTTNTSEDKTNTNKRVADTMRTTANAVAAGKQWTYLPVMDNEDFRRHAHELVDWMADYMNSVREFPVLSQVHPGDIKKQLPEAPPAKSESFDKIAHDFNEIIMPGMTHWQSPRFHGYFPANSSPPSVLAEMLMATLGAQCMIWQTSPAAAELEEVVMNWLGQMIGIPDGWHGVIQDTASTATLTSLLTARELKSKFQISNKGFTGNEGFTIYGSTETHSSIDKAVRIAGLGTDCLRKVAVTNEYAIDPAALAAAIEQDLKNNFKPLAVVATLGTTGSTAIDPIKEIGEICRRHGIWFHVDAAFAGSALLLEDMRWMIEGIEQVDTFVFNPHKWLFTNFDCSAYYVKDKEALVRTFEILPEYLKTREPSPVNNYRDWGVPLGRRFRALKLWFVIRSYGVDGLKSLVKKHIDLAHEFASWIESSDDFELLAPVPVALVCFRYHPGDIDDPVELDKYNERILHEVNRTGDIFITHTKLSGIYSLRFVCANLRVEHSDVETAWRLISETARSIR